MAFSDVLLGCVNMIKKVVIPVAGLGTRLLPMTKELPKEMLPLFVQGSDSKICLKPVVQIIYEQLYDVGFREFGFIVGRGKRAVEDHFTPDAGFIQFLKDSKKEQSLNGLLEFYGRLNNSSLLFINQASPKGFGDAVYKAKLFTGDEPFLMHAGDDLVCSANNQHFKRIIDIFEKKDADAVFLVEEVDDPRMYGVIQGEECQPGIIRVKELVEKPEKPPSNLAIIASYVFKPVIYEAIESVKPDKNGEIQLADALQVLLGWNCKVYASKLGVKERRIDIGTPEVYFSTIKNVIKQ